MTLAHDAVHDGLEVTRTRNADALAWVIAGDTQTDGEPIVHTRQLIAKTDWRMLADTLDEAGNSLYSDNAEYVDGIAADFKAEGRKKGHMLNSDMPLEAQLYLHLANETNTLMRGIRRNLIALGYLDDESPF